MIKKNVSGLIGGIILFLLTNDFTMDFINAVTSDFIYSHTLWMVLTLIVYISSLIGLFFIIFFSFKLILLGIKKEQKINT